MVKKRAAGGQQGQSCADKSGSRKGCFTSLFLARAAGDTRCRSKGTGEKEFVTLPMPSWPLVVRLDNVVTRHWEEC